jgi:diaminopimelate epimerase
LVNLALKLRKSQQSGATLINNPLNVDGETITVTALSLGNPHRVTFVKNVADYPVNVVVQNWKIIGFSQKGQRGICPTNIKGEVKSLGLGKGC